MCCSNSLVLDFCNFVSLVHLSFFSSFFFSHIFMSPRAEQFGFIKDIIAAKKANESVSVKLDTKNVLYIQKTLDLEKKEAMILLNECNGDVKEAFLAFLQKEEER